VQAAFEERRTTRSLARFVTSVCAIVGGLYTVMGLVEKLVASYLKRRKTNL